LSLLRRVLRLLLLVRVGRHESGSLSRWVPCRARSLTLSFSFSRRSSRYPLGRGPASSAAGHGGGEGRREREGRKERPRKEGGKRRPREVRRRDEVGPHGDGLVCPLSKQRCDHGGGGRAGKLRGGGRRRRRQRRVEQKMRRERGTKSGIVGGRGSVSRLAVHPEPQLLESHKG